MADRWIKFRPAYDRRNKDPKKDYGIHGVETIFYLRKPKGIMQFVLYTNWQLKSIRKEAETEPNNMTLKVDYPFEYWQAPLPADVGFHSIKQRYEHQEPMDCDLLKRGKCYYDGSGLAAEDAFECLIEKGEEGLWSYLEDRYESWSSNG